MAQGQQLIKKNLDFINILPSWAQELSVKYCSKTANLYFVHGNIRDFLPHKMNEGEFMFVRIQDYISEVLFGNRDIIVFYDKSSGISFCMAEMEKAYIKTMTARYPNVPAEEFLTRDPVKAFDYLERYFVLNIPKDLRIVLIIDYAETIVPADEIGHLDEIDRYCLVTLNRWSHEPQFTRGDVSVIMLTENLTDINPRLSTSPSTVKVTIPFPDQLVRTQFLEFLDSKEMLILERGLNPERIGVLTSGLNLLNLNQLVAESYQEDKPITLDYLRLRKRAIIENEAAGLLEFVETEHDLSFVGGHGFVKKRFQSAAKALKQGRIDVLPMGYLIAGPVGTGKTFMVSAFAGEIGIPMVKLRNFRSKWQGATESNLEKVLNILKAMSPVAVMIDEADAFLGDRDAQGDSGTSNRVFAQIANFMGNTEYRGKIIWFLITCRPDLLPIDLKRQGRAEEHLALFYPETVDEKVELFRTLQRKLDIKVKDFPLADIFKSFKFEVSGSDIEAILVRSKMNATMDGHTIVTREDIDQTIRDFIPPAYPHEIELQNLVAVLECTSREMVPARYQKLERSKLAGEIQELKQLLGEA
ncbi:MAG: AAA family ATPase [Spirochaetales bacterium]|nr:AAA family ATPase [Spirochaetales bacterium]